MLPFQGSVTLTSLRRFVTFALLMQSLVTSSPSAIEFHRYRVAAAKAHQDKTRFLQGVSTPSFDDFKKKVTIPAVGNDITTPTVAPMGNDAGGFIPTIRRNLQVFVSPGLGACVDGDCFVFNPDPPPPIPPRPTSPNPSPVSRPTAPRPTSPNPSPVSRPTAPSPTGSSSGSTGSSPSSPTDGLDYTGDADGFICVPSESGISYICMYLFFPYNGWNNALGCTCKEPLDSGDPNLTNDNCDCDVFFFTDDPDEDFFFCLSASFTNPEHHQLSFQIQFDCSNFFRLGPEDEAEQCVGVDEEGDCFGLNNVPLAT